MTKANPPSLGEFLNALGEAVVTHASDAVVAAFLNGAGRSAAPAAYPEEVAAQKARFLQTPEAEGLRMVVLALAEMGFLETVVADGICQKLQPAAASR